MELYLGPTQAMHPPVGEGVARGETQSIKYMTLGFCGVTD
jgi:hypothetical protein